MTDIKDIINQAILNEVEGAQFYRMAATQNTTPEAVEALNKLAEEELAHIDYLKRFSDEVAGGDITVDEALSANVPSPEIYSWGKLDKQSLNLALSVFSVGMQMERDSIAFYEDAKKKVDDPKAKKVFDELIKWEQVHLDQFATQYDIHKKEWWADQGFSPC
ncbi:ferritin-like domain-containing protein [Peptococcus simiae]|uniref:Ferritin-like domain-containing protein n=1 Tax=Peptococcus simiae TaxID=1643805 RepID=A0ABW9GZU4_9FIRM